MFYNYKLHKSSKRIIKGEDEMYFLIRHFIFFNATF
jgi:hypothetical protein